MKKLLALVLALVMTLGLATVGTNAALSDFSDADQVSNEEAMAVMNAVGVFVGSDGKLDPKGSLTRAAAAKLVAYLALGEDIAEALPKTGSKFVDVPDGAWYTGYVSYMVNEGYTSGTGANTFSPDATLTGYQFGAFLLAVLGYDRALEGMIGSGWETKVAVKLEELGLAKNVDSLGSAALTREEAAQYCLNALKATCVEYADKGTSIAIGDATITTGAKKANEVTVASATDIDPVYDAISASRDGAADTGKDYVQLGERLYKGKLVYDSAAATVDNGGHPAAKWYYNDTATTSTTLATTIDSKYLVITAPKAADKTLVATSADKSLQYWVESANKDYDDTYTAVWNGYAAAQANVSKGDVVEIYVSSNDAKDVDRVIVNHYVVATMGKVTAVSGKDYDYTAVVGTKTWTSDNLPGFDASTMVKDERVLVLYNQGRDKVLSIELAKYVTGKMTSKSSSNIGVDGTSYKYIAGSPDNYSNTYNFYLDKNDYVVASKLVEAVDSMDGFVTITEVAGGYAPGNNTLGVGGNSAPVIKLKVAYMDGKTEVVEYQLKSWTSATTNTTSDNIYVYDVTGDSWVDAGNIYVEGVNGGTTTPTSAKPAYYFEVVAVAANGTKTTVKYQVPTEVVDDLTAVTLSPFTLPFYAYSKDSNGKIKLTEAYDPDAYDYENTSGSITKNSLTVGAGENDSKTYTANSSTKLVVIDVSGTTPKTATYTGYKNFPTVAVNNKPVLILHEKDSTTATTIYALDVTTSEDVTYAYYTGTNSAISSDKTEYTFYVDGAEKVITLDRSESYTINDDFEGVADTLKKGHVYKINEADQTFTCIGDNGSGDLLRGVVTEADDAFFDVVGAAGLAYADDAKVWDLTGSTVSEGKITEGDSVIFVYNPDTSIVGTPDRVKVAYIVKNYVADLPATAADIDTVYADDSGIQHKLTSGELAAFKALAKMSVADNDVSLSVDEGTIYLTGTVKGFKANAANVTSTVATNLSQYFGSAITNKSDLQAAMNGNTGITIEEDADLFGFVNVVINGENALMMIMKDVSGTVVRYINSADATFSKPVGGLTMNFDITGLDVAE